MAGPLPNLHMADVLRADPKHISQRFLRCFVLAAYFCYPCAYGGESVISHTYLNLLDIVYEESVRGITHLKVLFRIKLYF